MKQTWRYRLDKPFRVFAPELIGVLFKNRWLSIRHGELAIDPGYAWDGCSPSIPLFSGLWVGTWDGPVGSDGRPVTWRASLVHDAMCQFRLQLSGVGRLATIRLFKRLLQEDGAPAWIVFIYPRAVSIFGPQKWPADNLPKNHGPQLREGPRT